MSGVVPGEVKDDVVQGVWHSIEQNHQMNRGKWFDFVIRESAQCSIHIHSLQEQQQHNDTINLCKNIDSKWPNAYLQ